MSCIEVNLERFVQALLLLYEKEKVLNFAVVKENMKIEIISMMMYLATKEASCL